MGRVSAYVCKYVEATTQGWRAATSSHPLTITVADIGAVYFEIQFKVGVDGPLKVSQEVSANVWAANRPSPLYSIVSVYDALNRLAVDAAAPLARAAPFCYVHLSFLSLSFVLSGFFN